MTSSFLTKFKTLSPINLVFKLLLICGLMNQEGRPWTLITLIYNGIMLMLLGSFAAVKVYLEMDHLFEILQPTIICIGSIHLVGKFVNILVHQTKIRNLLNLLEQLRQQELEDPLYASQIIKTDNFVKTIIFYMNFCLNFLPFSSAFFNCISDYLSATENPTLVLPLWMPWNYQKSWPYVAALAISTLITLTAASLFGTFYSLLLTLSFQMSTLLKVLQAKMEVNRANDKSIFRQHINILQILQQINELFAGQYYLEILISSLQPCGYCYVMIKAIKTGDSRWMDIMYKLIVTLFAPLMMCVCGEEINSQVEKLHESSYRSSWYEEQPAARRDLLILMTATTRPLSFNYRGLITFNLISFSTVMQAFYSYITMLTNLQTND